MLSRKNMFESLSKLFQIYYDNKKDKMHKFQHLKDKNCKRR